MAGTSEYLTDCPKDVEMRKQKLNVWLTCVMAVSLIVPIISGGFGTNNVKAGSVTKKLPHAKLSKDLLEHVHNARGYERVRVIVQPSYSWGKAHDEAIQAHGGDVKQQFGNLEERVVELPTYAVELLAARDDVEYVSPDREIESSGHLLTTTGAYGLAATSGRGSLDGTGIGIAIFDSGVDSAHISFTSNKQNHIVKSVDFTGEGITTDPYGHGTHVASMAIGSGNVSTTTTTSINTYQGMAFNSNVVNVRVLNSQGKGTLSGLLNAVDWVLANRSLYKIRVANMSLGMAAVDSYQNDPACKAVRRMVDAGIVVVVAAGNNGKDSSGRKLYGGIHSPGNEPSAITVGATNTYGTDARSDDTVTTYSSRGPTRSYSTDLLGVKHYDNLVKPDLVAPGNKIVGAQAVNNYIFTNYPQVNSYTSANAKMMWMSGTSVAAPAVAGAAALVLQANPSLTPNLVKMALMYTAQQLPGYNMFEQGAGEVNVRGATDLAKRIRTDLSSTTPLGAPLLTTGPTLTPQSIIASQTVTWAQGINIGQTAATGTELITKYQKIYGLGTLLGNGVLISNGVLIGNGTMISNGVLLGNNILISTGITLSEGTYFCGTGVLLGNTLPLNDGDVLGDGVMTSDGVMMADGTTAGDYTVDALNAMVNGDNTACMK
ncbi:MAG: S8 family serine peptidase [Acidobacteria bacterium]|nr:S8 family serine peptidase [Acidobacteriota bacterium]